MNSLRTVTKLAFRKVTHVIFDLDGLLLDSEPLYTKGVQNVVKKYGLTYDWNAKQHVLGLTGQEQAQFLVKYYKLPLSWEQLYDKLREQYYALLGDANLMPDTESVYFRVFGDIAQQHGKKYTHAIRAKVIGTTETDSARIAVNEMQLPISAETFLDQFKSMADKSLRDVNIMPGAERIVRHLYSNKVPMAVATSSGMDTYEIKVAKHADFFKLFSHVVTGGSDPEVKNGKPSPEIFLVCASRFRDKPKPEQCLVFEDAPNGVEAAIKAGMQVVMVPDKLTDEQLCKKATLKLETLEQVKPELFGLPPFK